MTVDLRGRSVLKELDFTPAELRHLIDLTGRLKTAKRSRTEQQLLTGRNIALVFEKTSTRTRCGFEVAAHDQGAHVTYLDPTGSQLGVKESTKDTARVLGRMFDGIEYRGSAQTTVETLAAFAGVPVWNGLSDEWHPTQMIADMFTMQEHSSKPLEQIAFCYVGDARNNVARSLLVTGALLGMDVRIAAPERLWPDPELRSTAQAVASTTGARVRIGTDVAAEVRDVDFVYTDVWVSMGEPAETWAERIALLGDFQVDRHVMEATGNADARFMHCLPALHDTGTSLGASLREATGRSEFEVTDEVFESSASIVFDQAENRLHSIKAILVATLGDD